ncbi:MAG TPA: UDP-3-O-(3-hydroxymyristoyl)glucosamine N-acyltransferase [Candidatus Krumholzibacteria bacterium]|nr:UDP-3-O-(3-hydroxymyristoyl)glucosamine N-acyltransferase [Candidatus Krumholzibacteria bacterium]HPD71697.1 UDP-3-O-(3-hydroxymyristoyl)glucosamine N-acyltransferase [Candidatus Krumholzibacteria bacterium]HRY41370.1 UDP-3-O-(3-hydroxymyristoyl)glucosamine N-acyltransferase [Candidatus Krumholzibacteria bacterium]
MRLRELAVQLDAELIGDGEVVITGAAGLEHAGAGDITFVARPALAGRLAGSPAAAVIVGPHQAPDRPALRVADPYRAFASLLARLATPLDRLFPPGVHPTAVVDRGAALGDGVSVGPHAVVGPGCRLGDRVRLGAHVVLEADVAIGESSVLYPHVVVRERCRLGQRVVLHPGCVIGADGFGYLPGPAGLEKIPQIGIVVVEDDVELGAGTCVDRATTGATVIGAGTKLDNLVQVGHNVRIGRHSVFSAQTGISGSCEIGDGVSMGGQVGLADHIKVGDGVKVGAKSGLHKDVPDGGVVFGYPALDAAESMRIAAALRRLPDLVRKVAQLERALASRPPEKEA